MKFLSKMKIKHEIASPNKDADFSSYRMRQIFLELRKAKSTKRSREANKLVQNTIKLMREELTYNLGSVFLLSFKHKTHEYQAIIPADLKTVKQRKEFFAKEWENYLKTIRDERKKLKEVKVETRTELGFEYSVVGGVFVKPGSIVALQSIENQLVRIKRAKKPSAGSKSNYVGVELEIVAKVDRATLNNILCQNYLAGYVYVKDDSSIQREMNSDYAHELTILCKENDVSTIIPKICSVLNSSSVGAYVNNSCGLHVHLDCRNRDHKQVYARLYNGLAMILGMVPKNRVDSSHALRYCKINQYADYDSANNNQDRYYAINTKSYDSYSTIEVRVHSGSTNAKKIVNFIEVLTTLISKTPTCKIKDADTFAREYSISSKLHEYINYRTKLFSSKLAAGIDTRMDHFFFDDMQQISL